MKSEGIPGGQGSHIEGAKNPISARPQLIIEPDMKHEKYTVQVDLDRVARVLRSMEVSDQHISLLNIHVQKNAPPELLKTTHGISYENEIRMFMGRIVNKNMILPDPQVRRHKPPAPHYGTDPKTRMPGATEDWANQVLLHELRHYYQTKCWDDVRRNIPGAEDIPWVFTLGNTISAVMLGNTLSEKMITGTAACMASAVIAYKYHQKFNKMYSKEQEEDAYAYQAKNANNPYLRGIVRIRNKPNTQ